MADLSRRVAIVTGASAGIGEATARMLAREGVRVAVCARRKDRLERLAAEIASRGGEIAVFPIDVTDATAVQAMVADVLARWDRVDALINNAGRGLVARFEQTTADELRALLELNVVAVLTATQAVLPAMRRQGRGHIVNVSSIVGRRNVPYRAAYGATKFALGGLSEALRVELEGTGIDVSLVYPIYTATEFHAVEVRKLEWPRKGPVQSADAVARAIVRCLRRPRAEVYPYRASRVFAALGVLAPRLVDRALRFGLRGSAPSNT